MLGLKNINNLLFETPAKPSFLPFVILSEAKNLFIKQVQILHFSSKNSSMTSFAGVSINYGLHEFQKIVFYKLNMRIICICIFTEN